MTEHVEGLEVVGAGRPAGNDKAVIQQDLDALSIRHGPTHGSAYCAAGSAMSRHAYSFKGEGVAAVCNLENRIVGLQPHRDLSNFASCGIDEKQAARGDQRQQDAGGRAEVFGPVRVVAAALHDAPPASRRSA